ncbi:hypothetical protein BaRGS_00004862 [Batillaria attramentaria]|uniref:Uncharacterized protein n=1 Tax=Batillaria attramentaria TaxID=370345 RepID=A0ABD0LXG3_9CAEN
MLPRNFLLRGSHVRMRPDYPSRSRAKAPPTGTSSGFVSIKECLELAGLLSFSVLSAIFSLFFFFCSLSPLAWFDISRPSASRQQNFWLDRSLAFKNVLAYNVFWHITFFFLAYGFALETCARSHRFGNSGTVHMPRTR